MARHAIELAHHHANPGGALRHFDVEQLLHRHGVTEFVGHRAEVIHSGDVGAALHVRELFARLFHARVQVANDGLRAQYRLTIEFEHDAQHAVRRGVTRTHVDDHGFVVIAFDVDVVRVESAPVDLQNGAQLATKFVSAGLFTTEHLLGALTRFRDEKRLTLNGANGGRSDVAHRGPGPSLNCTGTRPMP